MGCGDGCYFMAYGLDVSLTLAQSPGPPRSIVTWKQASLAEVYIAARLCVVEDHLP